MIEVAFSTPIKLARWKNSQETLNNVAQGSAVMNEKIIRFFETNQPSTPCLVVDLDVVRKNYKALQAALPQADIYYLSLIHI